MYAYHHIYCRTGLDRLENACLGNKSCVGNNKDYLYRDTVPDIFIRVSVCGFNIYCDTYSCVCRFVYTNLQNCHQLGGNLKSRKGIKYKFTYFDTEVLWR